MTKSSKGQMLIFAALALALFALYISLTVYSSSTSYQTLRYNELKEIIANLNIDLDRLATYSLVFATQEYNQSPSVETKNIVEMRVKEYLFKWMQTVLATHSAKGIKISTRLDVLQIFWDYQIGSSQLSVQYTLDVPSIGLYDFKYNSIKLLELKILNIKEYSEKKFKYTEISLFVNKEEGLPVDNLGPSNFRVQYYDGSGWKDADIKSIDNFGGQYYLNCTTSSAQPIPKVDNKYRVRVYVTDLRGIIVKATSSGSTYYPSNMNIINGRLVSGEIGYLQSGQYMGFEASGSNINVNVLVNNTFKSGPEDWTTSTNIISGTATYGYDSSDGNIFGSSIGSYKHEARGKSGKGGAEKAVIDFETYYTFDYSRGTPFMVYLSYAYRFSGSSVPSQTKNNLSIVLVLPNNNRVFLAEINFDSKNISTWNPKNITVNPTYFSLDGEYKLVVRSHLETQNPGENNYVKVNFDDIMLKVIFAEEVGLEIEFSGNSDTNDWASLVWGLRCAFTTGSVEVKVQLYDYSKQCYPEGGDGFIYFVSSSTPSLFQTKIQFIEDSPTNFRDENGNWKIKITCVSKSAFNLKLDWIIFAPLS
ncbi:MAG: hypothetical protein QW738_01415 [Nitrososphaeria archaeon]